MTAKKSNPIIVGLDHGNGWVKAKTSTNQIVLPSYFARQGALGDDFMGGDLNVNEYESSFAKGEVYVWGDDITKADKVLSTYGSQDRYKQKYYNLLNQFALVEVLGNLENDINENVWVITGVPSVEKGTSAEKDLKNSLEGTHLVKVNGVDKIVKVTKVVVLPQPVGTVMSLYLDSQGFVLDESYESSSIGIIDIGTGTTDIDHVKELRRQKEDMDSILIGMFDVYQLIAKYIKSEKPSVNVTPQKVEAQFTSDTYVISKRASIDIAEVKEEALEQVAMDIKNSIIQQWKSWDRFDEVIITGGGAPTLGKKLKELIDDASPVKDSQTANADGFYRYGESLKGE